MYYTRIKVFWYFVVIVCFLEGINCVDRENVLPGSRIGVGESGVGRVSGREINSNVAPPTGQTFVNAPPPIITPRKDGKIRKTKGQTIILTLKKVPKTVLLREVRRPKPRVKRPTVHQRRGKPFQQQPTNGALLKQQHLQQETVRQLQAQQQRFLENQAQQQRILAQNALQQQFHESQSFSIDQRVRNDQQAQQESLRQQAFLDAVAEQERKSYLQKKRLEQKRRRRFPDGLSDQQRLRNQKIMNEKQRELALRQVLVNDQQSLLTQQQSNFPNQQLLSGSASQQLNWIYQPQALEGGVVQQQFVEQGRVPFQMVQQQPFLMQQRPQSLQKNPKPRKQQQRLGRKVVLLKIRQRS
uniref:Uncharacterized protein n=1 Tax=Anopheles minimus TaxID=112268 RepID=A0A182WB17_9DIPT